MERKLVTFKIVKEILPIEGADRIELAKLDNCGWQCVVVKNEFKIGDKGIYFEIDSILPHTDDPTTSDSRYEFLRPRKFRIKTMKLRGALSQGLLMPLSKFPEIKGDEENLQEILKVEKYEIPESFKLANAKGNFPVHIVSKTDEERIQNFPNELVTEMHGLPFYITVKLDGCMDESTLIETAHGIKTVKEICDSKYKGKIKSYDVFKNKIIFESIKKHWVRDNNNDWYEIETENGRKIKLTSNHYIYLPDLKCWRKVGDLEGNESILVE